MAKLTDVPVVTSLDDADLVYGVDVSDPTDDPAGSSVAITKANLLSGAAATNLPVVQSAWFDLSANLKGSSEAGWSAVNTGTGIYTVTFPTAAATSTDQYITASRVREEVSSTGGITASINNVTATTCEVRTTQSSGTLVNADFTIQRRLPDAPAQAIVATQPAGTVVKEELGRITDPGAGGFVFSAIPQVYDRIIIKGQVRTTETITAARVLVNGDVSDSGYHQQVNGAYDGNTLVAEGANGTFTVNSSTAQAGHYASLEVSVEGYAENRENVVAIDTSAHYTTTQAIKGLYTIGTNDTTPLTQIQIKEHDGTGGLLGTLILYGERTI